MYTVSGVLVLSDSSLSPRIGDQKYRPEGLNSNATIGLGAGWAVKNYETSQTGAR